MLHNRQFPFGTNSKDLRCVMKQIIQIQAIWFNFKIDGMALYCSKHSLNMLNRSYHQYPLSNKKTAAVTVLHYIKIVIKINRRLNAKAYQLSTCLSRNSRNHKCPGHQSKSLNQDLDQLNYWFYLQACKGQKLHCCKYYFAYTGYRYTAAWEKHFKWWFSNVPIKQTWVNNPSQCISTQSCSSWV